MSGPIASARAAPATISDADLEPAAAHEPAAAAERAERRGAPRARRPARSAPSGRPARSRPGSGTACSQSTVTTSTASSSAPSSGRMLSSASAVGVHRADRRAARRSRRARARSPPARAPSAEQRQRRRRARATSSTRKPLALAARVDAERRSTCRQHERLQQRHDDRDRARSTTPMPRNSTGQLTRYMRGGRRRGSAPRLRRRASCSGALGRPGRAREPPDDERRRAAPSTMSAGRGLSIDAAEGTRAARRSAPQKKSVAPVPSAPPAGTA